MIHRIKSSVARFLHKLRHSDSDDMGEHHQDLFPSVPEHITPYCRKLEMINNAIGTEQLQSYQIPVFYGFKTLALSQHEYGRADVLAPSKKTFPLSFERMQGKTLDVDTASSKSLNTEPDASNPITRSRPDLRTLTAQLALSSKSSLNSLNSKSSLNSPSTSLSPQRFADDRVAALPESGKWNSDDRCLFKLTFESRPLYLYELAFLVEVIHQENQSYHLLSNNCYHLIGVIAAALKITHGAQLLLLEEHDDAGKCCGINFFAMGQKDIDDICGKFRTRLANFVSLLYVLSD
jgi:hypothetical protein